MVYNNYFQHLHYFFFYFFSISVHQFSHRVAGTFPVSLTHEGREPAVSGSTVVPDSSLPMNVPYFDVGAGLVEVLDVVSVSHLGCPHPSSLPVNFPDVNLQYHDDRVDGFQPEAYFRHSGDSLTTCPGHR